MTVCVMDASLESPPAPLLQRGEYLHYPRREGPSLWKREDRWDWTAQAQRNDLEITP